MGLYLGLDTSNYTTSAAAFDAGAGVIWQVKRPLPVKECGAVGASGLFQYVLEKGALHRNPVRKVSAAAAAAHFS